MTKQISRREKQITELIPLSEGIERWTTLYAASENPSLYLSPDWLSIYREPPLCQTMLFFVTKGGIDIAGFPFLVSGHLPLRMKLGGPLVRKPLQRMKPSKYMEYKKAILQDFGTYIKHHCKTVEYKLDYSIKYWYPLMWIGFTQSQEYHYILDIANKSSVWSGLETKIRSDIRKATQKNITSRRVSVSRFIKFYTATNKTVNTGVISLYNGLEKLANAYAYIAYNETKDPLSAVLCVEHLDTIYYIDSVVNPLSDGSQSLNIWSVIENSHCTKLNFLGSRVPSVERFFRAFGGFPEPYSVIKYKKAYVTRVLSLLTITYKILLGVIRSKTPFRIN